MQLAIFEILYVEDVPTGAAVSEAVRLAKKYDGDDTGSFVNGILGAFARGLNAAPAAEAPAEEVSQETAPAEAAAQEAAESTEEAN